MNSPMYYRPPRHLLLLALACAFLLRGPVAGEEANRALLWLSESIMEEEERQLQVNLRMEDIIRKFTALLDELVVNGLMTEGKTEELKKQLQVLQNVNGDHVAKAAEQLKLARQNLADYQPHISKADREIATIVRKLSSLVRVSASEQKQTELGKELKEIVGTQIKLNLETKAVGKKVVQGKAVGLVPLAQFQMQNARNTKRF
ncbi:MAG: hypothetical protein QF473_03855, partial [Planctomycetota bacterium]|nr:hypothetical protein [Planctomycetota bacterium]